MAGKPITNVDVLLFYPNLIGYARVILTIASYCFATTRWQLAVTLYAIGFVGDIFDGWVARKMNQQSQFGAILDMVTDRAATAGLLAILASLYPDWTYAFVLLICLDLSSHWFQVNSAQREGRHHKQVAGRNLILRAYYEVYLFFGFCCVGTETFYMCLYILKFWPEAPFLFFPCSLAQANATLGLLCCSLKQFVNLCQLASACMTVASEDANRINSSKGK
ncbi:unnamed protein product [Heterosigma akashiwo]|mmetsp:Transcript_42931/g.74496  ORF Transcript_42931/g.74496 Transcript_42931/m.74496 type:complete len:221 (-) Transcript_42931:103-765(-)